MYENHRRCIALFCFSQDRLSVSKGQVDGDFSQGIWVFGEKNRANNQGSREGAEGMKRMWWNRRLWGIEFRGADKEPMLIGLVWLDHKPNLYQGEPTRALLFMTRKQARTYCANQRARYKARTDSLRLWRFRPIRVQEIVKPT